MELVDLCLARFESLPPNFIAEFSLLDARKFSRKAPLSLFFDELRLSDELLSLSFEEFNEPMSMKLSECEKFSDEHDCDINSNELFLRMRLVWLRS